MNIKALIAEMTLEEKASLCVGGSYWKTKAIERLNIPSIMMIDGPSGINKLEIDLDYTCPEVKSKRAILFPSSSCTCCSFDRDIMYYLGETLGDELVKEGIQMILAPGVNIKRSPLCGRNFEYFSEDPFLSTTISGSLIKGVQSKGVGCCIKHFAANNQENGRFFCSSEIEERPLREIYLASFEGAVREAKPWAVMTSYNQVNNVFSSVNREFLTDILRGQWKWNVNDPGEPPLSGVVMSDWGGTYDRVEGVKAGLDLEMPGPEKYATSSAQFIVDAVKDGDLDEKLVDQDCERVLNVVSKAQKLIERSKKDPSIQFDAKMSKIDGYLQRHHQVVTEIAENCIVLLKNEDKILPLPRKSPDSKSYNVLFLGQFASKPHTQGAGSARVKPFAVSNPLTASKEIVEKDVKIEYFDCYSSDEGNEIDKATTAKAVKEASNSDVVVIFTGTPQLHEIENRDRKGIELPSDANSLISRVLQVNKNVVVVLQNGSPVEMPWASNVKAILETYLSGEGVGEATARILFGIVNPSGHLAESFPIKVSDNPSFGNFGLPKKAVYKEGIYVGYRHYDKNNIDVLFPFGHGLSYTTFEYSNIQILNCPQKVVKFNGPQGDVNDNDPEIEVSVDVKNTGDMEGKTVAQLYVADLVLEVDRPPKELKGFEKVALKPGEVKTIVFKLNRRSFAWWKVEIHDWFVSSGNFDIIIGQSSRDPNPQVLSINVQT
ncbi:hypothetical protein M9Y10_039504 [Tritrichomonas musculus]|uniref:beta-glucosidase n=1 Tax=Tritrichomonas musculus TaxID=1915356 RepID=A0ABR2KBE6_9EUKA